MQSSVIRKLLTERIDPVLYALSRDYVGDTAETASLLNAEDVREERRRRQSGGPTAKDGSHL